MANAIIAAVVFAVLSYALFWDIRNVSRLYYVTWKDLAFCVFETVIWLLSFMILIATLGD